jgi:hypothetical protein
MQISIKDFPIVIEPLAEVLELRSGTSPQSLGWTQLYRVPTENVLRGTTGLPSNLVHFFGPTPHIERNSHMLAYSNSGILEMVLQFKDDEWVAFDVPEEMTGERERFPSVRLIFEDTRARDIFLQHLERVQSGVVRNPTLALVLSRMKEQPRVIEVYSPHEQA